MVADLPNQSPARPPCGRWRRFLPLAATVLGLWLRWRWLRIRRRLLGEERTRAATHRFHHSAAEAMVRRAVHKQGLVIKLCQFLGSRADILMEEYVRTLSLLHDAVPPRPWPEMRALIESELGDEIERLYAQFDPRPVAAASLSQVYRARTHEGADVAVKVQYPEIERIVRWDLQTIRFLAEVWSRLETAIDFRPIVDEMERNAPDEIDFIHEGRAAEEIAALLAGRDDVTVPGIHWPLSSRRVLTMDYIDGIKITDVEALRKAGVDPSGVAETLIDLYNLMVLRLGMFHADPHPGNLFVLPGDSPRVGLVDFGLTKRLTDEFRELVIVLTSAIISERQQQVTAAMRQMGFRTRVPRRRNLLRARRGLPRRRAALRQGLRGPGAVRGGERPAGARAAREPAGGGAGRRDPDRARDGAALRHRPHARLEDGPGGGDPPLPGG